MLVFVYVCVCVCVRSPISHHKLVKCRPSVIKLDMEIAGTAQIAHRRWARSALSPTAITVGEWAANGYIYISSDLHKTVM